MCASLFPTPTIGMKYEVGMRDTESVGVKLWHRLSNISITRHYGGDNLPTCRKPEQPAHCTVVLWCLHLSAQIINS